MSRKSSQVGLLALLAMALAAFAVPLSGATVEVILGRGAPGAAGLVVLRNPFGVIRDAEGSVWWCEYDGQVIRRLDRNGTVRPVAGTGVAGYTGDGGPATEARLDQPHEIRFDREGHLYFTDMRNHAVRRVDRNSGRITTVAGTGKPGYSGDGEFATDACLRQPHSLQFDFVGNLYIGDTGNHVLRRIDRATGRITTLAGTGKPGRTPDSGPLEGAPLNGPRAIEFDAAGQLWLATREGNQLFRIDPKQRRMERKAGTGEKGPDGDDGPALEARLTGPKGVAVESGSGGRVRAVILVDTESHTLRRVDLGSGRIERVLGTGQRGDTFDPDPLKCPLARPHGVWAESDGGWLVGDSENHRILRVRP